MYEYISGKLDYMTEDYIVIDVSGIGYKIFTSQSTIKNLRLGNTVKIYTNLIVKEDDLVLYGFAEREELELFKLLISVSGVGPKAGVSLLTQFAAPEIAAAILGKDTTKLTKASGIGKKIAERIILELKDKINSESAIYANSLPQCTDVLSEVIEALTSLGYNYTTASAAVAKLKDTDKPIDALLKDALRQLSM